MGQVPLGKLDGPAQNYIKHRIVLYHLTDCFVVLPYVYTYISKVLILFPYFHMAFRWNFKEDRRSSPSPEYVVRKQSWSYCVIAFLCYRYLVLKWFPLCATYFLGQLWYDAVALEGVLGHWRFQALYIYIFVL
jgi:hypothetical protein